jgi:hypothetical protein
MRFAHADELNSMDGSVLNLHLHWRSA